MNKWFVIPVFALFMISMASQAQAVEIFTTKGAALTSLTVPAQQGDATTRTFRVNNTESGSVTVTLSRNLDLSSTTGKTIDMSFNPGSFTLAAGASRDITLSITPQTSFPISSKSGTVTATSSGTANDTFNLRIDVVPSLCKSSVVGDDLSIDIREPDSGDDFKPGDTIEVEVDIDNNADRDIDTGIEFFLYDGSDEIDSDKPGTEEINDGEDERFTGELKISLSDRLSGSDLTIYIVAFDDDDEENLCVLEDVDINLDLQNEDVVIDSFTLTPATAQCGDLVSANLKVFNIGDDDTKDVYIELENSDLGVEERTEAFDLDKFGDKDNDATKRMTFKVPEDVSPGAYTLTATAFFDAASQTYISSQGLNVVCSRQQTTGGQGVGVTSISGAGAVTLDINEADISVSGNSFSVPVKLTSTAGIKTTYTVSVTNIQDWAKPVSEKAVTLNPGQSTTLFFLIEASGAATGRQGATMNVQSGSEVLTSKTIAVNLPEGKAAGTFSVGSFFENNTTLLFIIGDIILIVVAIFFIKALFLKKR